MPTYVYKFVDTGETIEVQQSFSDDALTEYAHPDSGELLAVKKVFQPVGVTFKGGGEVITKYYKTNELEPIQKMSGVDYNHEFPVVEQKQFVRKLIVQILQSVGVKDMQHL